MPTISRRAVLGGLAVVTAGAMSPSLFASEPYGPKDAEITLVVTDPLALPLACSCVQGYAQRKYEKLAEYLKVKLRKSVRVVWADSIEKAKKEHDFGKKTIFIGKDSVVRNDTKKLSLEVTPIAQLTDTKGSVDQRGVFVVRFSDPAASIVDLEGYKVLWGPEKCDEKSAAPRGKLKELEIETQVGEICDTCAIAARKVIESPKSTKVVGVISSYAERLLTGCGTIEKNELRIIGESEEVPFISVFVTSSFDDAEKKLLTESLTTVKESKSLLEALESKEGFLAYAQKAN